MTKMYRKEVLVEMYFPGQNPGTKERKRSLIKARES